ncbi:MAG: hypothetical protein RBG13Loki_3531 [Promethearchaeota archaeon CR_4]|nr:MAG: hypothetical protein RBG13Loki_3531 [Candidatus Lokiarchaeota archaeon CR_4]
MQVVIILKVEDFVLKWLGRIACPFGKFFKNL